MANLKMANACAPPWGWQVLINPIRKHLAWNSIIPAAPGEDGSTKGYGPREINNRVCGKQRIWSEDEQA